MVWAGYEGGMSEWGYKYNCNDKGENKQYGDPSCKVVELSMDKKKIKVKTSSFVFGKTYNNWSNGGIGLY